MRIPQSVWPASLCSCVVVDENDYLNQIVLLVMHPSTVQDGAQQSAPEPPYAEPLDAARPPPVRLRAFSWARRMGDASQGAATPLEDPLPGLGARSAGASAASPAVTPRRCSCPGNLPPPPASPSPSKNPVLGERGDADGGASRAPDAPPAGSKHSHPLPNPASAATSARTPSGSLLDDDTVVPPGFRSCPSPGRSPRLGGHGSHRLSSHALARYASSAPASPDPPQSPPLKPAAAARAAGLASFGSLVEYAAPTSGTPRVRGAAAASCSLDESAPRRNAASSGRAMSASCSLDASARGPDLGRSGRAPAAGCSLDAGAPGLGLSPNDRAAAAVGAHARTASASDLSGWVMGAWDAPPAANPDISGKGFGGAGAGAAPESMPPSVFAGEACGAKTLDTLGTGRVCDAKPGSGSDSHGALTTLESWGSFEVPVAEQCGGASGSRGLERGLKPSAGSRSRLGSDPDANCADAPQHAGGRAASSAAARNHSISSSQLPVGATEQPNGAPAVVSVQPKGGHARLGGAGARGASAARVKGMEDGRRRLAAWEAAQLTSFAQRPG